MSYVMHALMRRMASKVSNCPDRILLNSVPEFSALKMAWKERSCSSECEGRWLGPGWYELSGFYDGTRSVATLKFVAPHPQGLLNLERR